MATEEAKKPAPKAFKVTEIEFVKPYALIGPNYEAVYYPIGSRAKVGMASSDLSKRIACDMINRGKAVAVQPEGNTK